MLFWHLLTREQDYAFGRPSLTRKKLRQLELRAGAERQPGRRDLPTKNTYSQRAHREHERELSQQAEIAYRRLVADWKVTGPAKVGTDATPGRASQRPSSLRRAGASPASASSLATWRSRSGHPLSA